MPSIYYFSKYFEDIAPKKTTDLFRSNAVFLANALESISVNPKLKELHKIARNVCNLKLVQQKHLFEETEKNLTKLAEISGQNDRLILNEVKTQKSNLVNMYDSTVTKLNILLVDNDNNKALLNKISKILANFCFYNVKVSKSVINEYSENILCCDFVVLTSAHPQSVFEEVQFIQAYCIPGIVFASIDGVSNTDKQALRNACGLIESNVNVLFKVLTPIRLYTSIDKIYMNYHLKQSHLGEHFRRNHKVTEMMA